MHLVALEFAPRCPLNERTSLGHVHHGAGFRTPFRRFAASPLQRLLIACHTRCLVVAPLVLSLLLFAPSAWAQNGVFRELYSGLTGSGIANLTNAAAFPNSPSSTNTLSNFEVSQNTADAYGQRLRALVVPPSNGTYVFWIASDDQSQLYLSSDESAFNKVLIARVNGSTSYRQWTKETNQQSGGVVLEAGRRYYLEALHKEGTGNDNLSVRWRLPGGAIQEPLPGSRCRPYGMPASSAPAFTSQPTNVTVMENSTVQLLVTVANLDAVSYQWQRGGTNLPGARGATLTLTNATLADHGAVFRCVATNTLGTSTSSSATLAVLADTNPPALYAVANLGSNTVHVLFSEPVEANTATTLNNYSLSGGVTISAAAFAGSPRVIQLTTTPLARGGNYTLTVNRVRDRAATANVLATNSQASFTVQLKGVYREVFTNIIGGTLADLTNSPAFPDGPSSAELMTNAFEPPANFADTYGQRLRALLVAPVTGNYTFWIAADDVAELRLGTNDAPASARRIASCTAAMWPRQWDGQTNQKSAPISLVAGRSYYVEALMVEGFNSDSLAVRWQLPDGSTEEPIPVTRLVPFGMNPPLVSLQPTNTAAVEGGPVTFALAVSNADPVRYQWQQNGTNLPGATNAAYTIARLPLAADGFTFQCLLWNAIGSTNTVAATLTVTHDTAPPVIVRALNNGLTNVVLYFSEPMDVATANRATNYTFTEGAVLDAALQPDARTVVLTTTPLSFGNSYTVTVNHLRDQAATPNVIGTDSQLSFTAYEFFPQDVGAPPLPAMFTGVPGGADLAASGRDIGGTNDQFCFASQQRAGNFDVRVRVQRLDFADTWTEAGLMAREDLTTNSRFAAVLSTPIIAGNYFQSRTNAGSSAAMTGTFPVNHPYTWLRLQRAGHVFSGFASFDGQTWTQLGAVSNTLPPTLYLGFALAGHSVTQAATAEFRNFSDASAGVIGALPIVAEPIGPSSRRTGLAISEIMFHPRERDDGRKTEFIELFNSNPVPEDLSGYRLCGSVDFTFPPGTLLAGGAFLVVARSPSDLQAVTGIPNVTGPYSGSLPNSAGTVRLRNRTGAILLEVNFSSRAPWPASTDGAGHSLVLARPSLSEGDPRAWAASDCRGGSPGCVDGILFAPERQIVINEFLAHTDPPAVDFVELYNRGPAPVNLSGFWLSDDLATNKFRVPDGTFLAPTSCVAFTETELGFALSSAGETIFLLDSNRIRVLDSVQFEGQENGVATGRAPDGSPGFVPLSAPTPGARNSPPRQPDLVINEIMYHPITENDDDEFVELHNRSGSAVSLANWRFTDGIDFEFPPRATISAGGYLIVARDAARLMANSANLTSANTVGDFEGSLRNSGERLALSRPADIVSTNTIGQLETNRLFILVDEVTYGTGGCWGRWSDGGGSSLELIDPRSDNGLAPNWADSDDTAKSCWTLVTASGPLDNGGGSQTNWNSLQICLHDAGECLVDDVTVSINGSANLVPNFDFASGPTNWFFQGNHCLTGWDTSGHGGSGSLHVRASGRGDTGANRIRTTLTSSYTNGLTGAISAYVKWLHGKPEILFRLRGNHLEAPGALFVPPNLGTPGARNSRFVANAGPAIHEVTHNPVVPAASQPVLVTARVNDPDGLASVQCVFRLDPLGAPVTLAMTDDGTGGDVVSGDGLFSVTIPGQTNGALAAFFIQATDWFAPPATTRFPSDAPERECLVRFGDAQPNSAFGTYRFWLTKANFDRWVAREKLSNEPIDGTFIYGNWRAIYNAGNQYAGSPYHSPGFNSPTGNNCDYHVRVPADDSFLNATEFTLQMPGNGGGDTTCQQEQTAYWFANRLDAPFLYRRQVNVFLNGTKRGYVLEDTQQPNADFDAQWFPDGADGDLYKVMIWFEVDDAAAGFTSTGATLTAVTSGGVKKLARYRQNFGKRAVQNSASDYTNLFHLVDTLGTTATGEAYARLVGPVVDFNEWARTFAVERIVGNTDVYANGGGQNCYIFKPAGGAWQFLIWDIDFAFATQQPTYSPFNFSDTPITKMFNEPLVRRLYWQALEDAVNGPLVPANAYAMIDARHAAHQAAGVNTAAPTALKTWIASRRDYLRSLLAGVRAPFAITNYGGSHFTNATTVLTLSGSAPPAVRSVTINGVTCPLVWTTITNWTVTLPLTSQTNVLLAQGYDAGGHALANATASITVYFNGSVSRAEDSLVINEIMFNPAVSNAAYVELFNRSTNTTFDLSGFRLRGVDFDFPPGARIGPRQFLLVAQDTNALLAAHPSLAGSGVIAGEFNGRLDPDGETLSLVRLAGTNETLIDQVKYEIVAPWLADPARPGSGVALQVIDPAQDNARVSNWGDAAGWRFFSFIGQPGGTRLYLFLDSAGDIYLDDLWLTPGTVAGAGTNLVRNGDFESAPLSDAWTVSTNVNRPYAAHSAISAEFVHAGRGSLHLVLTNTGSTLACLYQDFTNAISTNLVTTNLHTLSYWYLPSTNASNLSVRMGSAFRPLVNVRPLLATPGTTNSVAATLPPYPLLWLNEVQPENPGGLQDNTGTPQPWIELFNSGTNLLSLDGFFLAGSYANPTEWPFPAGTLIGPGEFRVIFADGQPELSTGTVLHTSFRLSPTNGSVVLSRGQQILDYLNFANVQPGASVGARPDGQLFDRRNFYYVTPGASNNPAPVPVAINEWMASNTRSLVDPATGRYEDWFELFNFGSSAVDLSGCYLTDDLSAKTKWRIPDATVLAPRGFLMCWADNDATGTNTMGDALHVNFQLSRRGDEIGLFSREGLQIDAVIFGDQASDISQGRFPDGNVRGVFCFMTNATPATQNATGENIFAPALADIADATIDEGSALAFTVTATDADVPAQRLTFSLVAGAPFGAVIDPMSGQFTWTPLESQGGATYPITVRVSDNGVPVKSDSRTFRVTVSKVNSAPVLAALADRVLHVGDTLAFDCHATDTDLPANTLTFSLGHAPAGAEIAPTTGAFTWTPSALLANTTNIVTVAVTDDGAPPLSDEQSFSVIVVTRPAVLWVVATNGTTALSWSAVPGAIYRVQFTEQMNPPDWRDLDGEVTAESDTAQKTDFVGSVPQRFYRILLAR
ncbi:MAG: lamin tail domain-containing protein [Verrucomicrobia bacterium]|nr:lamin tail domain-containing protein [Verrucomicrobiota bacterium]